MSLNRVMAVYDNASHFEVVRRAIAPHEVIDSLVRLPSRWKELIREKDDMDAKDLFFQVWRLCWDTSSCLVPFDSPDLDLQNRLIEIERNAKLYPSMSRQLDDLQNRVAYLLKNPTNPKGESVFAAIEESKTGGKRVGLVARMMRIITPGWQDHFSEIFGTLAPGCELIKTRRELLDSDLDVVILPGSGLKCPFVVGLHSLYKSPVLMIISYKNERFYSPELLELPPATLNRKSFDKESSTPPDQPGGDKELDDWISNEEWELHRLHAQEQTYAAENERHQFLVRSRLVLLESGSAIYLRDDRKVQEVSALASGEIDIDDFRSQLPRKLPKILRSGDLIVVRTSGSGDYLEVVADQILKKEGKEDLRNTCTDWKERLRTELEKQGAAKIAELLQKRGSSVSFPNYIWHWTTNDVIRPQKKETFADLINVIFATGDRPSTENIDKYIDQKWRQMRVLIRYQLRAGMQIRKALLDQLRALLESSVSEIDDQFALTLPGVDAGELTLFKVAAVDKESSEIPYTKVGIIID